MHLQHTFTVEEEDTEEEGTEEEEEEEEQCPPAQACPPHSMAHVSRVSAARHSVPVFLLCLPAFLRWCLGFCIYQSLCLFVCFFRVMGFV